MHWASTYRGRPWASGAEGPAAFDCWGLVRAVLRDRAGIALPRIQVDGGDIRAVVRAFKAHPELAHWREVEAPRELDAALMAQARHPVHVGLYLEVDGGRVLHCGDPYGVVAVDLLSLRQHGYKIMRWYRHDQLD